jgi:HlyD family secretion protein
MNPLSLVLSAWRSVQWAFNNVRSYAAKHLFISGVVGVVIIGGAWWGFSAATTASTQTLYVLGTVSSSTIISSVSESGQVSTTNTVDVKPQVSGTITWVGVKAGQTVRVGQALATIDDSSAVQALNDAKRSLAADKLQFQQAQAQAPVNFQNDTNALSTAKENLTDDYNDTFNDLTGVYLDLPDVISGAQETLYGYDFDPHKSQWNMDILFDLFSNLTNAQTASVQNFEASAKNNYATADTDYTTALSVYQTTTRTFDNATADALLAQSITMMTQVAQSLQSELNFLGSASDLAQNNGIKLPSSFSTVQSNARNYLSTANSDLTKLLADKKTLDNDKQTITNDQQTITLDQVGNPDGTNPISLQVSQNSIQKEEEDLASQEANLADYTIVAPFAGVVSAVDVQVGDSVGSSAVASVISNSQIAQLSVNEVDVAKIKLGEKATLTFDAIDSLTLTGTVAEIDSVGTVSQGVVSYSIQIAFDAQNAQVKPGMTVNADIQTAVAQDVLSVPSSAVKTSNGQSYVLVFNPPLDATASIGGVASAVPPTQVPVTTGISDDTNIEITSGLVVGQQIVVSTRSSTAKAPASTGTTPKGGGNATFGGGGGAVLRSL